MSTPESNSKKRMGVDTRRGTRDRRRPDRAVPERRDRSHRRAIGLIAFGGFVRGKWY